MRMLWVLSKFWWSDVRKSLALNYKWSSLMKVLALLCAASIQDEHLNVEDDFSGNSYTFQVSGARCGTL